MRSQVPFLPSQLYNQEDVLVQGIGIKQNQSMVGRHLFLCRHFWALSSRPSSFEERQGLQTLVYMTYRTWSLPRGHASHHV